MWEARHAVQACVCSHIYLKKTTSVMKSTLAPYDKKKPWAVFGTFSNFSYMKMSREKKKRPWRKPLDMYADHSFIYIYI